MSDDHITSDDWFWNARYKFVWERSVFIDYYQVMVEVIIVLIKEYSSTPQYANIWVSPEIGILRIPDLEDSEKAKGFAIYIADIRIKEPNTTLFAQFQEYYTIFIGKSDFSRFIFSQASEVVINRMRERQKLNKHFRTLANKSLNHQRKIGSRLRYQVLLRDKSTCQICGLSAPSIRVHLDHKIPVSWDKDWKPSSNIDDYQVLCEDCNLGKSDMSWIWSV